MTVGSERRGSAENRTAAQPVVDTVAKPPGQLAVSQSADIDEGPLRAAAILLLLRSG